MLVATVINQQKYDTWDYASASLLVIGAAGFAYDAGKTGDANSGAGYGIALLTVSIFCDALVPNVQQRLMGGSNEVRCVAPGGRSPHVHHSRRKSAFYTPPPHAPPHATLLSHTITYPCR